MRLMAEKGEESQQDRYYRIKKDGLNEFEFEMISARLTNEQRVTLHKHCDEYYGCVPLQEQMMLILMDEEVAGFSLSQANDARKIVAKKQMSRIPELKELMYSKMPDKNYADYVWKLAIAPSLGYAFSINHSLPYSFVGIQTLILATQFNPIYWNTACLVINSGSSEDIEIDGEKTTDYAKIAKAIGDIQSKNIAVSLVDINRSSFGFKPDIENNEILYGMKALNNVGSEIVNTIIKNRPYLSMIDFLSKVQITKQPMISLIKAGAFDKLENKQRKLIMAEYIWLTCDKKKRITLQNMNGLIQNGLIPETLNKTIKVYEFNKYLKANCKYKDMYLFNDVCESFYRKYFDDSVLDFENNYPCIKQKVWDKMYTTAMNPIRDWIKENHDTILDNFNKIIFKEDWDKYAKGNLSTWEMESMCFYYGPHELFHINKNKYGITDFNSLSEDGEIDYIFKKAGRDIPIYKLHKIVGTVIAKNKTKSTLSLLTLDGVVEIRFRNEYFSMFDKQISEKQEDGSKKIVEKSWFNRGSMIMVTGYRRGDDFVPKTYAATAGHQLYKITSIDENGNITLTNERYQSSQD